MYIPSLVLVVTSSLVARVQSQNDDGGFRGCAFPDMAWATTSIGTSGAFWPRDAHVMGDHLIVVGDIQNTNTENTVNNYGLMGPFSKADPTGSNAVTFMTTIENPVDVEATGDDDYDIGINIIDINTGEPIGKYQMYSSSGN